MLLPGVHWRAAHRSGIHRQAMRPNHHCEPVGGADSRAQRIASSRAQQHWAEREPERQPDGRRPRRA